MGVRARPPAEWQVGLSPASACPSFPPPSWPASNSNGPAPSGADHAVLQWIASSRRGGGATSPPVLPGFPMFPGGGTEPGEIPASSRGRPGGPERPASPQPLGFHMSPGGGTRPGGGIPASPRLQPLGLRPDGSTQTRPAEGPTVSEGSPPTPLPPDQTATQTGEVPAGQGRGFSPRLPIATATISMRHFLTTLRGSSLVGSRATWAR